MRGRKGEAKSSHIVDLIAGWSLRGIDTTSLCNISFPNEFYACTLNMCAWGEGRVGIY